MHNRKNGKLIAGLEFQNLRSNKTISNLNELLRQPAQECIVKFRNRDQQDNSQTIPREKIIQYYITSAANVISKLISTIDFYSEKSSTFYIWNSCSIASETSTILEKQLRRCLVKTSTIAGMNLEFSQTTFFKMTCEDLKELRRLPTHHVVGSSGIH